MSLKVYVFPTATGNVTAAMVYFLLRQPLPDAQSAAWPRNFKKWIVFMSIEDNNARIRDWAVAKGIIAKSSVAKQLEKTAEELIETAVAAGKHEMLNRVARWLPEEILKELYREVMTELKDGYGDIHVTCVVGSQIAGLSQAECVQYATDEVTGRVGEMVNWKFVKDE